MCQHNLSSGVMKNQSLQERCSACDGLTALFYDIRYKRIAQLPPLFYHGCDSGIMPRLAFVCSVITDVGGEYTELCPAHIYIIVHYRVHEVGQCVESGDIMTPEGENRKARNASRLLASLPSHPMNCMSRLPNAGDSAGIPPMPSVPIRCRHRLRLL